MTPTPCQRAVRRIDELIEKTRAETWRDPKAQRAFITGLRFARTVIKEEDSNT